VCERLARTDSYLFAWIGYIDTATQTVNTRTEAGVEGYLDDITISVDPDDERSSGPTGRALQTGEVDVVNDTNEEPRHDPWRDDIEEYGFHSSAAIPIVHEDTIYGVLNVYAERTNAFVGQEREMIAQLGEIIGHAIAATERKQALMSDELIELEFQIDDLFDSLGVPGTVEGTISLDHTVAVGNEDYLIYGSATPDAMDTITSLVEALPHWESVSVRSGGDRVDFELRVTDPPVVSVVASLGGYVDSAVVEDGDYRMSVHLSPTADVRKLIDAIEAAYPGAEMIRRQQINREADEPQPFNQQLDGLTDRQRSSLEAAYYAGFFEWPRDASGEEVAESLGVAPPTFHQHLRKAERKIFETMFSSPIQTGG
jgi:predicted DNA binding protein